MLLLARQCSGVYPAHSRKRIQSPQLKRADAIGPASQDVHAACKQGFCCGGDCCIGHRRRRRCRRRRLTEAAARLLPPLCLSA